MNRQGLQHARLRAGVPRHEREPCVYSDDGRLQPHPVSQPCVFGGMRDEARAQNASIAAVQGCNAESSAGLDLRFSHRALYESSGRGSRNSFSHSIIGYSTACESSSWFRQPEHPINSATGQLARQRAQHQQDVGWRHEHGLAPQPSNTRQVMESKQQLAPHEYQRKSRHWAGSVLLAKPLFRLAYFGGP